jgi:hypothetical protein
VLEGFVRGAKPGADAPRRLKPGTVLVRGAGSTACQIHEQRGSPSAIRLELKKEQRNAGAMRDTRPPQRMRRGMPLSGSALAAISIADWALARETDAIGAPDTTASNHLRPCLHRRRRPPRLDPEKQVATIAVRSMP